MPRNKKSQSGSVLIYILIGVVLFGMIMFTVSRGNNVSTSTTSKGNAKLQAHQIIDFAKTVETAVQKLTLKGCSENQISFELPAGTRGCARSTCPAWGYVNASAPADKSCHVFEANGGNIKYMQPLQEWNKDNTSLDPYYFTWGFYGSARVFKIGTGIPELIISITNISNAICMEINNLQGIPNNGSQPFQDAYTSPPFTGTYGADPGPLASSGWPHHIGDENVSLQGKTLGCGKGYGSNYNNFYAVLLAR